MPFEFSVQEITDKIKSDTPIVYQVSYLRPEDAVFFLKVMSQILIELKKEYLDNTLTYILRELLFNADKSNLKRAHFIRNQLDIYQADEYQVGMENFATEFREKLKEYQELLEKKKFYTKVIFIIKKNGIIST